MEREKAIQIIRESDLIEVKPTKKDLKKILKWTSSKFNEYKKNEVIEQILKNLDKDNCYEIFNVGSYTEKNGRGTNYIFIKEGNEAYIINEDSYKNYIYKIL